MEPIYYKDKKIELKDGKYNMKDIFNVLKYEYEPFFQTNEMLYYSLNEFEEICKEDKKREMKLLLFLIEYEKNKFSDIFEFIKNDERYNNLKLGNWFKDVWFTLFEGKNILITNDVLNFIYYGPEFMAKDYNPKINNYNEKKLIKILNDKNIEYLKIKHDNPLSLQYKYIQD